MMVLSMTDLIYSDDLIWSLFKWGVVHVNNITFDFAKIS